MKSGRSTGGKSKSLTNQHKKSCIFLKVHGDEWFYSFHSCILSLPIKLKISKKSSESIKFEKSAGLLKDASSSREIRNK